MKAKTVVREIAAQWKVLLSILAVGVLVFCVVPVFTSTEEVEPPESLVQAPSEPQVTLEEGDWESNFRNRWKKMNEEAEERRKRLLEAEAKRPPIPKKKVRRFRWESPAETRGRIWNVPEDEAEDALLTALLRVCISEADGDPQDCAGIWQVVKNNRQRTCRRGVVRRITECEEYGGETHLSALRRHQRHVLGKMKARNRRAVWIRNLTPDCEMPDGYVNYLRSRNRKVNNEDALNHWDSRYGSKACPQTVADARRLIEGKLPESRPGQRVDWLPGRPVTWGGRCEEKMGSCDDRMACERVLARIPNTETLNAFWCRIGNRGCRSTPEPLCEKLGYRYKRVEYKRRMVWKMASPLEPLIKRSREEPDTLAEAETVAQTEPTDS